MATEWIPLDRKRILEHFRTYRQLERIDRYLQTTHDLLPNEKVILLWLAKVFEDSHATIDLYVRHSAQLLNHARKDFHHIGHQDVEAFLQGFRYRQDENGRPKPAALRPASPFPGTSVTASVRPRWTSCSPSCPRTPRPRLLHNRSELHDRLRAVELCALDWHDLVNWQRGWYFDVVGKDSKARRGRCLRLEGGNPSRTN